MLQFAATKGAKRLAIDVIDTGVGMRQDKLENIFEAFVQADSSVARHFGGTGLGLAISRRFARALGGDVVVRSEVGEGSVFTVLIDPGPLADVGFIDAEIALSKDEDTDEARQGRWQFPPARVLVVDDGEENRELIDIVLGDVGLQVESAENGKVGLEKATSMPFDVVLMDMQMPVMDGRKATRLMREQGLQIPIIALTANAMKGFAQQCIEFGCSGYLTKPVDVDELVRTLAGLLGGEMMTNDDQPIDERQTIPSVPIQENRKNPSPVPVVDERFQRIQEKFIIRLVERIDFIEQSWEQRDFDELASFAHWLKGSAGTVGLTTFVAPAERLEDLAKADDIEGIEELLPTIRRLTVEISNPNGSGEAGTANGSMETNIQSQGVRPNGTQRIVIKRLRQQLDAIEQAWNRRDFGELGNLAHWLNGAVTNLGYPKFAAPAHRLEKLAKEENQTELESVITTLRHLTDETTGESARLSSDRTVAEPTALPVTPPPLATHSSGVSALSESSTLRLSDPDPRLQRIRASFAATLQQRVSTTETIWQRRDYDELSEFAHWLKGSAGTLGFDEFTDPARSLETLSEARDEAGIETILTTIRRLVDDTFVTTDREAV